MSLTLDTFLPYRLARLAEAVSQEIRPIYVDRFGLNRSEWRVLVALADLQQCTATAIAEHSYQHKTKVSRAVWALEQRGWLKRAPDPADRRAELLSLTGKGQRACCDLVAPMQAREAAIVGRLTIREGRALEAGLIALEEALGLRD